jgi:DNA-binding transcriptional MocR family regulator
MLVRMGPSEETFAIQFGAWLDVPLRNALQDWREHDGPMYERLAVTIGEAIRSGELPPGKRLPPERIMAAYLDVGRRTVARAYAELSEQGFVERRQGSGTKVVGVDRALRGERSSELATSLQRNIIFRSFGEDPASTIDLLSAYAPSEGDVVRSIFASAGAALSELTIDHHGYNPAGYPPLRAGIAARLSSGGVPTTENEILVTSGAQQAISLIAATFVKPRETVVTEDPTVPGSIDAFRAAGARLLTLPVGQDGADVERLESVLRRNVVSAVYLMPTHQSPTGVVMPVAARHRLVRLARETGVPIIEDDTLADLALSDSPTPPSLAALAETAPILSIGSLSKLFWAGLRIGWIRGPSAVIAHLAQLKAVADLGTSTLTQAVGLVLLDDIERMRAARRDEMRRKLQFMESVLRADFEAWSWKSPAGGLCLWVRLPHGSALELTQFATRYGVAIAPGTITSPTNRFDDHIRLPFSYQAEVVETGMARLASAWNAYTDVLRGVGDHVRVVV